MSDQLPRRLPGPGPGRVPGVVLVAALLLAGLGWAAWGWCGDGRCGAAALADPAWWGRQHAALATWQAARPLAFLAGFVALFALLSALSLPGCAPLCVVAGAVFGTWAGALVVGAASTLGALGAFLAARHLAREAVQRRHGQRLRRVEALMARHGRLAVFGLRIVPLVPYAALNPLLGLTRLPLAAFAWPSLAGLVVGSLPYAWAGAWLAGRLGAA